MEVEKFGILSSCFKRNDTIKKLFRLPVIKRFEEDEDLLEDLVIETTASD